MWRLRLMSLLLLSGCGKNELICSENRECISSGTITQGLCLQAHCAFHDPQCASLYRWDDSAGPFAGMCVEERYLPDAAVADGGPADGGRPGDAAPADATAADAR